MVKKDRFISFKKIAENIENTSGTNVSPITVRNRIRAAGFNGRVARKKPFLSKQHKMRRLDFAKKYVSMPIKYWKRVLWSDESKFNLKTSDGAQKVWRKPGEAFSLSCVRGTVKHGGGNVMVWGCMSWKGVGNIEFIEDIMNADHYISILGRNIKSSVRKLHMGRQFIFQHDNDPKHTAKKTTEFLEKNGIEVLEWPAQSPDINPIEHLWAILDTKLEERSLTKKIVLQEKMVEAWNQIDLQIIKNLVESMPKRLEAVIKANGGPTKY